jgi:hypothetical protein
VSVQDQSIKEIRMSNMKQDDDNKVGTADKDQRDREQRARDQQRQQSTGQPKSAGAGQQGGQQDDRTGQQGGKGGLAPDQSKTQR